MKKYFLYFLAAVVILYCCSCAPTYKGTVTSLEGNVISVDNNRFVVTDTPKLGEHVTLTATSNRKKANAYPVGHHCQWILCPYKTITPNMYVSCVKIYTEEFDTMAYWLDIFHLRYPRENYEKLEARASKIMMQRKQRQASRFTEGSGRNLSIVYVGPLGELPEPIEGEY